MLTVRQTNITYVYDQQIASRFKFANIVATVLDGALVRVTADILQRKEQSDLWEGYGNQASYSTGTAPIDPWGNLPLAGTTPPTEETGLSLTLIMRNITSREEYTAVSAAFEQVITEIEISLKQ